MADESSFLKAILANPTDDLPRLVYADWLDEQGTEEGSQKAEFLRLTVAVVTEHLEWRQRIQKNKIKNLARHLSTDWLPVVSRLPVENCVAAGNLIRRPLRTIEFEFECPKKWEHLKPTEEDAVRYCDACRQNVYYCETIGDARQNAARDRCIAVDVAIPRKDGDLRPRFRGTLGKVLPNSVGYRQRMEQRRRMNVPDEVSAEREARRGQIQEDSEEA